MRRIRKFLNKRVIMTLNNYTTYRGTLRQFVGEDKYFIEWINDRGRYTTFYFDEKDIKDISEEM